MSLLDEASRLYAASNLKEAEAKLTQILAKDPSQLQARVMLGVILSRTRRHAEAIEILESVTRDHPDQFDSYLFLALSKKATRQPEDAVALCQKALALNPKDPTAYNTLGLCLLSAGRSDPAVEAFCQALRLAPKSAGAYHNLGLALRLRDDTTGACEAFEQAIALDPANEANYLQLTREQTLNGQHQAAMQSLEKGLKKIPTSIAIQDALAAACCRAGDKERGEALFKDLLAKKPGFCHSYSVWLQEEGRFEESIALLNRSLEIEPIQGMAYFGLAEAKSFVLSNGSKLSDQAEVAIQSNRLTANDRMYLAYSLGRSYEQSKNYEAAIKHFDQANDLAFAIFNDRRKLDYDRVEETYNRLIGFYSKDFITEHSQNSHPSQTPIFIVGMIRSGTTLLDQILSSHPKVASAGELSYWKLKGAQITPKWFDSGVDRNDIQTLATEYLELLAQTNDSERVTDKQPLNYEKLGLIHIVFPKAKFIHIRRNPLDTCLSIYTTHFGSGPNFAYDKQNIVFAYKQYLRLMDHWRQTLPPESLLEIDYESLISTPQAVVEQILDFCNLPWDEACLHHDSRSSTVSTPSRWQARQPVYASSVGRWRRYEPWLGSLLDLASLS